ncbi:MAG: iron ABC transporter permease [Bacteroidaceae bacterium]|nr:iron ABC transporter permease [Bacteroidaceae bacterium]
MKTNLRLTLGYLIPLLLLLLLATAALLTGSISIAPAEVWQSLFNVEGCTNEVAEFVVLETRLPRMLTAMFSGAALAIAGLLMQNIFANPLADPSILGVNSGAGLGVAIVMLLLGGSATAGSFSFSGYFLITAAAFLGAIIVILFLLLCSIALRGRLPLLIAGVMISFIASSVIALLNFYATAQGVRSYMIWGLGDFGGVAKAQIPGYIAVLCCGLILAWLMAKPLNVMQLGADYATNLGVRVSFVRTAALLLTGLLTAIVTAFCGPVSFIGLAVPHAARLTLRTADHRHLIPTSILWGGVIALFCNVAAYLPSNGGVLPLNALTPLIGAPIVLLILFRRK